MNARWHLDGLTRRQSNNKGNLGEMHGLEDQSLGVREAAANDAEEIESGKS